MLPNSSVYDKNVARQLIVIGFFLIRQHMRHPDENKETPLPAAAPLSLRSLSCDLPLVFGLDWKPTPEFLIFFFFIFLFFFLRWSRWHVSMFFRLFSYICFSRVRLASPRLYFWPILIVTVDDFDSRVAVCTWASYTRVYFSSPRDGEVNFWSHPIFFWNGENIFVFIFIYAFAFGLLPFVRSLFLLSRFPFSFLMRFYEHSADSGGTKRSPCQFTMTAATMPKPPSPLSFW